MQIEWEDSGPELTDDDIVNFERLHGVRLTEEHKWFLLNISNGGRPVEDYIIPTRDCPGGAAALHSVYGIGHPERGYDLSRALHHARDRARRFFPFASDEVGGDLLIDLIDQPGRLVYNPSEPDNYYYSSDSIQNLLDELVSDNGET